MEQTKTYICIDLKSFYASVECVERGLDAMEAKLVVADPSRGERTICLAVSPAMKALGVRNRCRVFEIPKNIDYITAPPRMQKYIEYSTEIYGIYLRYVAAEDIQAYSIDEVFIDATAYMEARRMTPEDFARSIAADILRETGITASCGIGTNLYLAKIAMDVLSKRSKDHLASLTEESYRQLLWDHRPLSDFWRISTGTIKRLERIGIQTMRDICMADEKLLYKTFGIDAELLIDHAWGRESATMADIKNYRPRSSSVSTGQVLHQGRDKKGARLLVLEMAELLSLELVDRGVAASSVCIYLSYSRSEDIPPARGSFSFDFPTSSTKLILQRTGQLYDKIAVSDALVYRINLGFGDLKDGLYRQYDFFSSPEEQEREHRLQTTLLGIKKKYGRNGIFKGMNLLEGATTLERNAQIGGHKA